MGKSICVSHNDEWCVSNDDFQIALREALETSGITQRKISKKCGISHALIQSMLTGKSKPKTVRIELMADALKLVGPKRGQFIDSAKRANSDVDITKELQELRCKQDDLLRKNYRITMSGFMTIVVRAPTDPTERQLYNMALDAIRPFQTGASLEDEMTILERIEMHPDFPEHIAQEIRPGSHLEEKTARPIGFAQISDELTPEEMELAKSIVACGDNWREIAKLVSAHSEVKSRHDN